MKARTVKEVTTLGNHPGNMGPDYIVYVNDVSNPTTIMGYREGSNWYSADGKPLSDPSALDAGQGVSLPCESGTR
jgi:hypothetical protein